MKQISLSIAFAAIMILVALGIAEGLIPQGTGTGLLLGLPALAMSTIRPARSCRNAGLCNRVLG